MTYHNEQDCSNVETANNMAILPLKTQSKGPAKQAPADKEDIVDVALKQYRLQCFFSNFLARELRRPNTHLLISVHWQMH